MALMTWNDSFSVGVQTIDSQHKVLFDIMNELHSAMMAGEARKVTGPLLGKLLEYTKTHFSTEEQMMTATEFPGLAAHKVQHGELIKQVNDYVARHEKGEVALNLHLLNFLRDWLTTHIHKEDMEYSPWLKEHGLH